MSKLDDAREVLDALGMPKRQQNDNAAYTLLAFADVGPRTPWARARDVRLKPHDVIIFAGRRYKKRYAENTRETIRRQAIHQFVQGAVLRRNPDEPDLATNSPRTHYALSAEALEVLRAFGTPRFAKVAAAFRDSAGGGLAGVYAKARNLSAVPVTLPDGGQLILSPGRHNVLQRGIVELFLPHFAPEFLLLYMGDTDHKTLHVDDVGLRRIGVAIAKHDKLPDVVAWDRRRNWLFLIEAVTSHGPVTAKRQIELEAVLRGCKAGMVYVSAFLNFREYKRHADEIAWETEVWLADMPGHMLHYNGDRFLGPRR